MKYRVTEEYIDPFCPSGEQDQVYGSEVIEARDSTEAEEIYRNTHRVDRNNSLRTAPIS